MFFNDIQLVIKKCLYFILKIGCENEKKMTTLNNSKKFTIIFDHQFDINEKQNWGTSETILGFQTSFPHPARSFFLTFNTMMSSNLNTYIYICIYIYYISTYMYIYIYIHSLSCNNIDIYLKNIQINREFYLHLQNTENFVLIPSRSKIWWHSHRPCIFPYFSNF